MRRPRRDPQCPVYVESGRSTSKIFYAETFVRLCRAIRAGPGRFMLLAMTNPFRYFNSSPDVIRLVVMMYVRYPLSLRNVEDLPGRARDRHQSRDCPVLVEPVGSDVRR